MKVLVTGGAGLVGMALRRHLQAAGHSVLATDITDFSRHDPDLFLADLNDHARLEQMVVEGEVQAIVHAGGISGPLMQREFPRSVMRINVDSTVFLLDLARRHRIGRLMLMSSHVVYGHSDKVVVSEEDAVHPGTTYAASKVAGEALVESFAREFGISAAALRLTRVYGPHRRANCYLRQAIEDSFVGRTTIIPCDPSFPYHFLSVEDVAGATLAALAAEKLDHSTYNVGSGEVLTMDAVRNIILAVVPGARIELVEGRDPAPEVQNDFSLRRMAEDAGWRPQYPLSAGFANYYRRALADGKVMQ
ncbi:nucleoside-diphosphate-sugar epimerase [Devosia subaequoris]|uniref:Nucleoside-diphosphate-sugar epimerase n=1 Tax=Devosia subaequoris TaxID=395930 RepID=A0A7W6IQH7_9HYPH|nr:nucleoside-diphosphate-sugar epimerase [Devosia subaequoris]MCP1211432.1 NAD(P)-dependent oxidoreductase [Devosia subaequoris]